MKTVYVMLRHAPEYPRKELEEGIRKAGDTICNIVDPEKFDENSVVVTWNKYGVNGRVADKCIEKGGLHVAMENGYFRREDGFFIMSRNGFNGKETDREKMPYSQRWQNLGIALAPWKKSGSSILVCAQRGGGYSDMAMHDEWPSNILPALRTITDRPIIYRPHPARQKEPTSYPINTTISNPRIESMGAAMDDAFAIVVWTSNSATDALIQGIPAFYCGPTIATRELSIHGIGEISTPRYAETREEIFSEMAWLQWHKSELSDGSAWRYVTRDVAA
jgi:hypothetical protein